MRLLSLVCISICLLSINAQLDVDSLILATNQARTNPKFYANLINAQYLSKGINGTANDTQCYAEAVNVLNRQPVLPALTYNAAAALAIAKHIDYLVANNLFSHIGANNTNLGQRLDEIATKSGNWTFNENIAWTAGATSAQNFTTMWLHDCGVPLRGHRKNIFNTIIKNYGCYHIQGKCGCVGTTGYNLTQLAESQLDKYGLRKA